MGPKQELQNIIYCAKMAVRYQRELETNQTNDDTRHAIAECHRVFTSDPRGGSIKPDRCTKGRRDPVPEPLDAPF